jgi:hypothetical protein
VKFRTALQIADLLLDDLGDPLLKRSEHLLVAETCDPRSPGIPDGRGKHQLVPELEQVVGLDVEPHLALGALPQNLLVDAGSIRRVVEIVT